MAVRLKDIARELGVSVVTVSKVLRNHSDISPKTKARVLKRMRELDYRPNLAARALVTGKSYMVGLVVPDLVHPFFGELANGMAKVLRAKGYSVVVASSEEDPEIEQQEIDQLLSRRVDALLVASAQWTVESFRRIEEQRTPYILIDRRFRGLAANFVGVDDELAGSLATAHLAEQGCRRIAHIRGGETSTAMGRLEGYRRVLRQHDLPARPEYVVMGKSADALSHISGYEAMQSLLGVKETPDAVFCYNDPTALGAMKAILEAGYRVPDDIAVIGCGNVTYAELLRVPLSSVDQQTESIGQKSAELALELIGAKRPVRPKDVLLEPRLVVRASSKKPSCPQ